jgi:hypothetical protein
MARLAAASFLLIGLGAAIFGLISEAGSYTAIARLGGFVALTLSLILAIVGTPSIRDLVG